MKKIALIFLLSIYAISSLGVGIRQFYCCGTLQSTEFDFVQKKKDNCPDTNIKEGCCKTTVQYFKVKDSHVASVVNLPLKHLTEMHLRAPSSESATLVRHTKTRIFIHTPPEKYITPLFILNGVYRI